MTSFFEEYQLLAGSKLFDRAFYLESNPDVAKANADPIVHYLEKGALLGRKPCNDFDVEYYRQQCESIDEEAVNPLLHFIQKGAALGLKIVCSKPDERKPVEAPPSGIADRLFEARLGIEALELSAKNNWHIRGNLAGAELVESLVIMLDGVELGRPALEAVSNADAKIVDHLQSRFDFQKRIVRPRAVVHQLKFILQGSGGRNQVISLRLGVNMGASVSNGNLITRIEEEEEIRLFIEKPDHVGTPGGIKIDGDLSISGWAVALAGIERIDILVDGQLKATVQQRKVREDVRAAFPGYEGSLRSGFEAYIPRRDMAGGDHDIEVRATDKAGSAKSLRFSANILGETNGAAKNYLDLLYGEVIFSAGKFVNNISIEVDQISKLLSEEEVRLPGPLTAIKTLNDHVGLLAEMVGTLPSHPQVLTTSAKGILEDILRLLARQTTSSLIEVAADQVVALPISVVRGSERFTSLNFSASDSPQVSIVIPAFNHFFFTHQCLTSIAQNPPQARIEIIVIDDGSKDETMQLESIVEGITVLRNQSNLGFIESCNRAAIAARGEYVMFLNNDATITSSAVDELLATFDSPKVGLVGSKLLYPDGKLQEAGGIIWKDGSGWNYGRGEDAHHPDYNYRRSVDYCSGAAIMLPKKVWDEIGGFDVSYKPAYYEDSDLAFRLREAGYDVYYQPLSIVVHCEGITSGNEPDKGVKAHQYANQAIFVERWAAKLHSHRPRGEHPLLERDRGCKRRALFIDATTPTPDQDAGSVVAIQHMKMLQSLGFKVTFIPLDNFAFDDGYTPALQRLGIEAIYRPYWNSVEEFLKIRGSEFELAYVHRFTVGEESIELLRKYAPRAPILFNNADLHYLRMMREVKLSPSQALFNTAKKVKERELAVIKAADCTVLCNSAEHEILLKELPDCRLYYLPWVVDQSSAPPVEFHERSGFMFLGGFGHPPNLDAVKYFIRVVMPHVRSLLPGVTFHIYGSKIPDEVRMLAASDILIEGHALDLDQAFGRHRISIAPLRFGAGFKGKIASSLERGVPVVATSIASEGTGLVHEQQILVANDPSEFAKSMAKLYAESDVWKKFSKAGRQYVEEHYSFQSGRQHLSNILFGLGLTDLEDVQGEALTPGG